MSNETFVEAPVPSDTAQAIPSRPVRVVGIGASAGGLESLRVLVSTLQPGLNACYAVAQHLSPTHRSMLVELLAREADLRVEEISHGQSPQADTIYITPASCHVRLRDGLFQLEPASRAGIPKPSVDEFFESLAQTFEERAIGVVLSGTGSDGCRGVRAIHAAGGCTVAQDPAEAKYDGMPRAAIESGCVDFVTGVGEIGARLARLLAHDRSTSVLDSLPMTPTDTLDTIVQTVKRRAGFDLGQYKTRTLERRIRRRAVATESQSLEDYADLLQRSPQEVDLVVREMFISVTQFFRDPDAFESLTAELGPLIDRKSDGQELRIWVPGCATGEEAYSLAMLVCEHFDRVGRWCNVRLFATDLDTKALAIARRGTFSASALNDLPAALAERYLQVDEGACHVSKRVRDLVIFSEHNVLCDPAFLRLDLVSCRNLLIYLQPEVQQQLLGTFARALKPGGLLFLGKAEALHARTDLFTAIEGAGHLYRSTGSTDLIRGPATRTVAALARVTGARPGSEARRWDLGGWLTRAHAEGLLPPFVLIEDNLRVLHVFGDVSRYLKLGSVDATLDLLKLAIDPIRLELRSMLLKARRQPGSRLVLDLVLPDGHHNRSLRLTAHRREETGSSPLTMVMFEEREEPVRPALPGEAEALKDLQRLELEEQLSAMREHLHTVITELESANEELQSLNEETQSSNEELQSANEELETSNEELQSTNEELITVNEELESRTAELSLLNADLHNVKNSLVDPIIVVDEHRRVTLFNPPAVQVFALDAHSIGALLFSLPCLVDVSQAAASIREVIDSHRMIECQINGPRSYRMRIQPYLDLAGQCKGAVLTFHDNTDLLVAAQDLARAHERIHQAERFASATIDALPEQIGVIDRSGQLVSVSQRWREALGDTHPIAPQCAAGGNYLATCARLAAAGSSSAADLLAGLHAVLHGKVASHVQEFIDMTQDRPRCGLISVMPFGTHLRETAAEGASGPDDRDLWVISHQDLTERKRQEAKIRLQAKALDSALSGISIAEAADGTDFPLVYVNKAFEETTGYTAEEVLGLNCRLLQGSDRNQPGLAQMRQALANRQGCRVLLRNYRKDGSLFWNEVTLAPIIEEGRFTHVVGMLRDITARLAAEAALKVSLERESQALSFAGLGSMEWDIRSGSITLSERHARLLGLPGDLRLLPLADYRRLVVADDLPLFDDSVKLCVAGHGGLDLEYRVAWPDGTRHWLHTRGNTVSDGQGVPTRILALTQDVSVRRDTEDKVRFIAHHDGLTGLPNRVLLRDRFQLALNGARRSRSRLAVIFIDLDHFKDINDSLGHEQGDALLVSVAERMRSCMRDTDTICRQSGDEFIVLLPSVRDANDAAHMADKLITQMARPHHILGQELRVTCSAGVSLYPDDGDTIDALMRHADSAMYHAKGNGRNGVAFFGPEMNEKHQARMSIANALHHAVPRDELRLHYQPQFDVRTGRLVGIEALVRWQHPERGMLHPDVFIPVAEDSDLIITIGDWVLHEACLQAARWHASGVARVPIAINISPIQLRQRNILEKVASALHTSGLDARWLELEITERALIHNAESVGDLLADFRRAGVRIALDDFGTGYSSLSYLHRFPVQKLKIDRSFVAAAPADGNAAAIIRAVISLARSMSLDVVAEGVETPAQLAFLGAEACSAFQGFLASRGTPAADLAAQVEGYARLCSSTSEAATD
ncbi:PAS domain S-box-containing protein/diguanylate cyclase (GGDEF)-like protein [Sphaerotilus hippei]|uniref:protein-glutamate O-methyltransferase n=1 Tax=Sphaerotilus hippei TaxID=744406 RepID=A0A318H377_9BURK|nr:EAL domain-containing protein [Sphaerotilus hippei]PXW92864.1 PAS domain S-box-containing protein/diguanylate cyclase (GGDEF)-like protein [Sphaerotilus hippei]